MLHRNNLVKFFISTIVVGCASVSLAQDTGKSGGVPSAMESLQQELDAMRANVENLQDQIDTMQSNPGPSGSPAGVIAGHTLPTEWKRYNSYGIYVDVDTSEYGFTETPIYITSLEGNANHWDLTGISAIYDPTPTGFRVYVKFANSRQLTVADAELFGWQLVWMAIP